MAINTVTKIDMFVSRCVLAFGVAGSIGFLASCSPQVKYASAPALLTVTADENAININTASIDDLQKLPNVGRKTAEGIVVYREKYGAFRRIEQIMLVQGISDKRFRELRHLIRIE